MIEPDSGESKKILTLESNVESALYSDSRFPHKDEILEVMALGEPEFLGSIDNLYPDDIAEHANEVEIINVNARELTEVKYGGKVVKCVFKPFTGESEKVKKEHISKIERFYPREAFIYALSEHFGFDIVPPTTVRDFGQNKVGALQLFIPTDQYLSQKKIEEKYPDANDWDRLVASEDFAKMLALDFMALNCDRNPGNYLTRIKRVDGRVLPNQSDNPKRHSAIAIDHGMCMDSGLYIQAWGEKDGPIRIVTDRYDNVPVPATVLELLKRGLEQKDDFNAELIDHEISEDEVAYMWMRVAALCKSGIFLSKYNIKKHPNLLREDLSSHPQLFVSA